MVAGAPLTVIAIVTGAIMLRPPLQMTTDHALAGREQTAPEEGTDTTTAGAPGTSPGSVYPTESGMTPDCYFAFDAAVLATAESENPVPDLASTLIACRDASDWLLGTQQFADGLPSTAYGSPAAYARQLCDELALSTGVCATLPLGGVHTEG